MKLGIISDTHNEFARTALALENLLTRNVDHIIHCGDISSVEILELFKNTNFWFTFGNHDSDNVAIMREWAANNKLAKCLEWGDAVAMHRKIIGVCHGHMYSDKQRVLTAKPDYLFHGHSHTFTDVRKNNVRFINPGALHRSDAFTVAILELNNDDLQKIVVE